MRPSPSRRAFAIGIVAYLVTAGCRREAEPQTPAVARRPESNHSSSTVEQVEDPHEPDVLDRPVEPPTPTKTSEPTAGGGFEIASPAAAATVLPQAERLGHGDAVVLADGEAVVPELDDDESVSHVKVWVGVEFAGVGSWLVHQRTLEKTSCDELVREVQEIAKLEDGRWLVDAQLACRRGEDYFSAENAHTVIAVDLTARSAEVLWTGLDEGSSAMGVCVSFSTATFELVGDDLVIRRVTSTELDREAAKDLPEAARGCRPRPERIELLERISLVSPP